MKLIPNCGHYIILLHTLRFILSPRARFQRSNADVLDCVPAYQSQVRWSRFEPPLSVVCFKFLFLFPFFFFFDQRVMRIFRDHRSAGQRGEQGVHLNPAAYLTNSNLFRLFKMRGKVLLVRWLTTTYLRSLARVEPT